VGVPHQDLEDLSSLSDTEIFDVLQAAYRRRPAYLSVDVVKEILRQMDAPAPRLTATATQKSEVETLRPELKSAHGIVRKLQGHPCPG